MHPVITWLAKVHLAVQAVHIDWLEHFSCLVGFSETRFRLRCRFCTDLLRTEVTLVRVHFLCNFLL